MKYIELKSRRYLGNKYSLIPFIEEILEPVIKDIETVIDLFSGTGVVGEYFLDLGRDVTFNDILYSNKIVYEAWFGKQKYSKEKIEQKIKEFNSIKTSELEENYFSKNFADTYFSHENTKKIGYIREKINNLFENGKINKREKSILVASLLYSVDRIANTVGHYDSFLKNKNGLDMKLVMFCPLIKHYENQKINIYRQDANNLVKKIKADLVYIDPPYNSRQYSDMYHLLENLAEWKKPKVLYKARKMDRKHIKSLYSLNEATMAFEDLINNIEAKYILVSYNNMGNKGNGRSNAKISDEDLKRILKNKGNLKIIEREHNSYTTGKTKNDDLTERFFLCEVRQKNKINKKKPIEINNFIKTSFNYTGSKYKLLPQLTEKFPEDLSEYTFIDLFCGGGNVGLNVEAGEIICNDINNNLIRLFKLFIRFEFEEIYNKVNDIILKYDLSRSSEYGYSYYGCDSSDGLGKYNKDNYIKLREDYNSFNASYKKDLHLLVLLIYSFNNQIRFNNENKFNMPVGKRDFNKSNQKNLYDTISRIKKLNIKFISGDYKKIDLEKFENPFLYCDPPYYISTASYNENGGWTIKDEIELREYLDRANELGVKFALSNVVEHKGLENTELVRWALRNGYNILSMEKNYTNSSYHNNINKNNNQITVEVLITNYLKK